VGEANCISSLGSIAGARSDHETARASYEEALALYRRIGVVVGEANCIRRLGDIAYARSDHETARTRFEVALALHRRIGEVVGEANCIRRLGDIAYARSDHQTACALYEEAQALSRRIGNVGGQAEATVRLGQVRSRNDAAQGLADIEAGFALYFTNADPEDRALPGWHAMHRALTCQDTIEAERHRDAARSAWTVIGRLDLVRDWVDQSIWA
jgi:tetratricopeptide (TPR) repeat protein